MNIFNRSFDQLRIPQSHFLPFNNLNEFRIIDQVSIPPGISIPLIQSKTNLIKSILLSQISRPTIAKCYKEIGKDLTLLWLFSLEEYSSIQEWPCLGALWFRLIYEGFSPMCFSQQLGKDWVEFFTLISLRRSGEITNSVILITKGVGERDLGMVVVFCHPSRPR